jgi:hypothetical protein
MEDEVKLNPHEQIGSFELLHELLDQFRFFIRPGRDKRYFERMGRFHFGSMVHFWKVRLLQSAPLRQSAPPWKERCHEQGAPGHRFSIHWLSRKIFLSNGALDGELDSVGEKCEQDANGNEAEGTEKAQVLELVGAGGRD